MKKIFFYIFLVISSTTFSQSKGRITYRIISEPLKSNANDSKGRILFVELMTKLNKIRDSISLNLDFKDKESIFYVDKDTNIGFSNEVGYNSIIKSLKTYYRNDVENIMLTHIILDKNYLLSSSTSDIKWEILKDKKKIGNYLCFKAIAKVKDKHPTRGIYTKVIEAWFSPSIPISLGPNNYGGLPGLIIELKEGKFIYYVKSLDFKISEIEIKKPNKGRIINQQEYFNLIPTITRDNIKEYIGN